MIANKREDERGSKAEICSDNANEKRVPGDD